MSDSSDELFGSPEPRNANAATTANATTNATANITPGLGATATSQAATTPASRARTEEEEDEENDAETGEGARLRMHKCAEILASLRHAGLKAKRVRSLSRRKWLIKICAPEWRLEEEAERLHLRMRRRDGGWSRFRRSLRHAFIHAIPEDDEDVDDEEEEEEEGGQQQQQQQRGGGGGVGGVSRAQSSGRVQRQLLQSRGLDVRTERFVGADGKEVVASVVTRIKPLQSVGGGSSRSVTRANKSRSLFHSSDRQTLINNILRSSTAEGGADLGSDTPLGAYVAAMFPLHMYARLEELRNDWLYLWRPKRADARFDRIGPRRDIDAKFLHPVPIAPGPGGSNAAMGTAGVAGATAPALPPALPSSEQAGGRGMSNARQSTIFEEAKAWLVVPNDGSSYMDQSRATGGSGDGSGGFGERGACGCGGSGGGKGGEEDGAATCCWRGFGTCPGDADGPQEACCCGLVTRRACPGCVAASEGDARRSPCLLRCLPCWLGCWAGRMACKTARSSYRVCSGLLQLPLDRIAAYFGEEVAFYFALLEFYTRWLVVPAVFGAIVFLMQLWYQQMELSWVPLFSLFVAAWSTLFIEYWKRHNVTLAHRWGVLNYEQEEVTRPQFRGQWMQDPITGEVLRVYPVWRRWLKIGLSTLVVVLAVVLSSLAMLYVFTTRDSILQRLGAARTDASLPPTTNNNTTNDTLPAPSARVLFPAPPSREEQRQWVGSASQSAMEQYESNTDYAEWWFAMLLPPVAYGFLIPLLDFLFGRVALLCNDWENHRTETQFRNHRVAKVFTFRFVNSFISLFYYAFSPSSSLLALAVQLASFLIVGQIWNTVLEVLVPCSLHTYGECRFRAQARRAEESGLTEGGRGRRLLRHAKSKAWVESRLMEYDTFNDYAMLLIQFGNVTFFSWAFPLAPLCALLHNIVAMRTGAYKLLYSSQRPIAHKASGIGVWLNVLQAMSLLAVLTNCAHIALESIQYSVFFPALTPAQKVLVIFVFEHIVLSLRFLVAHLIPHTPSSVQRLVRRDNWMLGRILGRRSMT
jgi:Calcium-activated chloride channel